MKRIVYILYICIAAWCIASCTTQRQQATKRRPAAKSQPVSKPKPATPARPLYSEQTLTNLSRQFGIRLTQADNIKLYQTCSGWLGVKYRYGGNSKNGVDCSGLALIIYQQVYHQKIERSTANILSKNCVPIKQNALHEGDLVFFRTAKSGPPSHVGIYLKNGKFIHASSSRGVIISSLSEPYYIRNWLVAGRVK